MAAYRINLHKSVAFLYTNNKHRKKILDTSPVTIVSKKIKYLRINMTKGVKDSYREDFRPLKKDRKKQKVERHPLLMGW